VTLSTGGEDTARTNEEAKVVESENNLCTFIIRG